MTASRCLFGQKTPKGESILKNKKITITILIFILLIAIIFLFRNNILKIIYPKTYKEVVKIYEEKYDIDENLIFALIKSESNFNTKAISNSNAIGLMQLMEGTAKEVAKKNNIELNEENTQEELFNIYKNIEIGTCYLSILMERYKNKEVALAAYNAGIGTVDVWIKENIIKSDGTDIENIPYKETNNYVRKILRDYKIYEDLYKN